jgi:hypothetical protein
MLPLTLIRSRLVRLAAGAIALFPLALFPATGQAVPPIWQLGVSEGSADFGSVTVGQSVTKTLQLKSTGNTELRIASGALTLSPGPAVLDGTTCVDRWLDPGVTCTVTLSFRPTAAGATTQTLSGVHANGTVSLEITGIGQAVPVETPVPTPVTPVPTPTPPISFNPAPTKADAVVFGPKIKTFTANQKGRFKVPLLCPADVDCEVRAALTIARGEIKGQPDPDSSSRRLIASIAQLSSPSPRRRWTWPIATTPRC